MPIGNSASDVTAMSRQLNCLKLKMTLTSTSEFDQTAMNASKVTWKRPWEQFLWLGMIRGVTGKCQHGPNLLKKVSKRQWGCEKGSDARPRYQGSSGSVKEAVKRVRGNGTAVSLHEAIPSRGFDAATGSTSHYTMRSGGAPFKTERVKVERRQEEDGMLVVH